MGIIIKIVLALTAMASMSLSSLGFRSDNMLTGFIFVIIAIIALVFLMKFLWELIGCAMTAGLIIGFIALILYVTGAFTGGTGFLPESATSLLSNNNKKTENKLLHGEAVAITGDTIKMGSNIFYMYGIASPHLDQTCISKTGRNYSCGISAKNYLSEKINGQKLACSIISTAPAKGVATPIICNAGKYDVGALMVAGGWAIPDTSGGMVYVQYEVEARKRQKGMWQGKFSTPWEWERVKTDQQQRMQSIKVQQPKKEPSLLMKNFWN